MTKVIAEQLRDAKVGRGRIINISSVAGTLALPLSGPYSGSKAFVNNFTRSLVPELSQFGIRIESHAPGNVRTQSNLMPLSRDCCDVQTYCERSLDSFGFGYIVYPFLPHFIQSLALRWVPERFSLPLVMSKRKNDKLKAKAELDKSK